MNDCRVAGFTITGDIALRAGWGASRASPSRAAAFTRASNPPPGFPALRRLAIALADSDNPRLRLESYFALTSNTVQFGGKVEFYYSVDVPIDRASRGRRGRELRRR